jgi:hypothetical protein
VAGQVGRERIFCQKPVPVSSGEIFVSSFVSFCYRKSQFYIPSLAPPLFFVAGFQTSLWLISFTSCSSMQTSASRLFSVCCSIVLPAQLASLVQVASQVKCAETIRPGLLYQYVITRNDQGKFNLYLNGYPCASGTYLSFLVRSHYAATHASDENLLVRTKSSSPTHLLRCSCDFAECQFARSWTLIEIFFCNANLR